MLIAGPNLTIDRTIRLDELRPGEVLRAREADSGPGGKGVNVARTAEALGCPAKLVAFLPRGWSGEAVGAWLADAGVALHAVPVPGEVRSAAIMLEASGRTTVLNEPGPPADEEAWRAYVGSVQARLAGRRVLVCSGSTPPASPADAYARLVRLAAAAGAIAIVDATGPTGRRSRLARTSSPRTWPRRRSSSSAAGTTAFIPPAWGWSGARGGAPASSLRAERAPRS